MRRQRVIAITTDFGTRDSYVGVVKGVILATAAGAEVIDLTHEIEPFNVLAGAWTLYTAYKSFPPHTVHLAVVDPGVGSSRRNLLLAGRTCSMVGPDNGLCSFLLEDETEEWRAFELNRRNFWRKTVSSTFHARDIFAPCAAYYASGMRAEELGDAIDINSLVRLDAAQIIRADGIPPYVVQGSIIYVDHYGNLITNVNPGAKAPAGVTVGQQQLLMASTYCGVPKGEPAALVGSHGNIEIGVNCGNAATLLRSKVGDTIQVNF